MSLLFALSLVSVLGRWQGESICTRIEANRACHDEIVQYDFVKSATNENAVTLRAQRLVEGKYEPMGDLDFTFDVAKQRWSSTFRKPGRHDTVWSFTMDGDQMKGTCVVLPDTLVRNVAVHRVK